jgi:hypothetical protein
MKGKIMAMIMVLMAAAMLASSLVGSAYAGKGQEKLSFQIAYEGDISPTKAPGYDPWMELIPKKCVYPVDLLEAQRWKTHWTFKDVTPTLLIDGDEYYCDSFTFVGRNLMPAVLAGATAELKCEATFTFDGIGTILVESTGKIVNLGLPTQYVVQNGAHGWGTGQLKDVKIYYDAHSSEGIIMGLNLELLTAYKQ